MVFEEIRKSIDNEILETKSNPLFSKIYSLDIHYFKQLFHDEILRNNW